MRSSLWSAPDLPELRIAPERERVASARNACSRACVIQSCPNASTPNLGGGTAIWSAPGLPELWIAPEREHVASARNACSRACVIKSCPKCQHSKLGWRNGYLKCSRLAGALDRAGAGTRSIGQKRVFPGMRHQKLSQVPALQTWVVERLFGVLPACRSFGSRRSGNVWYRPETRVPEHASSKAVPSASTPNLGGGTAIWSAPSLPELWIAPKREVVASARNACSRACVIQSCPKCQHSKLGWRNGYLECSRLAGALDRAGAGTCGI